LAWQEIIQAYGGEFPETLFYQTAGMHSSKITELLNEKFGYQLNPTQIAHDKEALFFEKYLRQIEPIHAIVEVAQRYHGILPMAVATGGIRRVATRILETIGVLDLFDTLVTAEDVIHGKPAPDTFLEAARRLNIQPELCHAFEDADLGIESAQRAGMSVTDVRLVRWPSQNGNGKVTE